MKEVSVDKVPAGAQLIDVREPDEYAAVRAEGAVNIPLSEFVARTDEIDPERDIYLICKSGGRSAQAGEYLEQARGWDNVINVAGGTTAWVEQGLPHQN
ncbi:MULTISPECIES: rhodanese-like domain-containing protein [Corynebacterium]|uniref:Rhodanese-like domain-containing protein n=2 Tax=Corynebacterium TaxID=1716 RepID=A0A7W2EBA0_9CORY|nr:MULTISPECIES: rhodanese-like domain-containing protein [Corynebacterium]MBA5244478.1 rhodanese-like domain-containing protein [Corynebacterium haemomassiliense]MBF4548089.1 rhodanese-like domain-containing protein [Corynebacterium afermentans subsp. lipophilum]MCG7235560.1 rhodanese-like domain-containing protein [Corynebacterium sp. ACRQP]MCG7290106.1 rhodanese-like domain-containing protein [Corynebacterium sp. ACRPZ]MCG7294722.1 rhodanese-like domain-containing protein [Corynebacterium s